jgi:hypothetical protein
MSDPSAPIDRLYRLLPAVHRIRDYERGEPLRALLQVISEQVIVVEDDIARLYDNWFIETAEDWAVPYIGDLIGWEPLPSAGNQGDVLSARGRARNRILIPRRELANTIAHRRRKGTLALLERLARDVADWPARAVEFYAFVAGTRPLNHPQPARGATIDLRQGGRIGLLGTEFDPLFRTLDVRRLISRHAQGRYNSAAVAVFVWRLKAPSMTRAPAYCVDDVGPHCFTFSALGNDTPLFTRPAPEPNADSIAGPLNVPAPISRRAFEELTRDAEGKERRQASPDYYGVLPGEPSTGNSLAIWAPDWLQKGVPDRAAPLPRERVIPADLTGWAYVPPRGFVAVDPVLGRMAFPPTQLPKKGVWVSYHYGFPADMGGGEYRRPLSAPQNRVTWRVTGQDQLRNALREWQEAETKPDAAQHALIEIMDSGVYVLPINITLAQEHSLQIRAAQQKRPVIRLLDWQTASPDNLTVIGGAGSRFTLDGVVVTGRGLQIEGEIAAVTIRHSTLIPGWSLDPDCEPRRPSEPSIELINTRACLVVEQSIVGSIQVNNDEVGIEPLTIRISDSIVDATGTDCDSPECEAIGAAASRMAHAVLTIARTTVIGRVMAHAIALGENSIFISRVTVARRQIGCLRFCYVAPRSRTPRRFRCQPDVVEQIVVETLADETSSADAAEIAAAQQRERARVKPRFSSTRYGTPTYCQLAPTCADEIVRGADDESEMGAFHDLYQPQRKAALQARLDEYTPASVDAGLVFAS